MANYAQRHLEVPPRWLNCPRKGSLIYGTFLPFKTPLDDRYNDQVAEDKAFNLEILFASLKLQKLKMGLIVDLTNTTGFYNSSILESKYNCKYVKVPCKGQSEMPTQEQADMFMNICERFVAQHPTEIIGVHCTHGFNRTGFFITSYLVEKYFWSVHVAVSAFSKSRAPGIYKQDYLDELFRRYDIPYETIPSPELPAWCTDVDDRDDDGIRSVNGHNAHNNSTNSARPSRDGREDTKQKGKFAVEVPGVTQVLTQPTLSQIQRKCQEMTEWRGTGFPGSQPVSMNMTNLDNLRTKPYKVSWKADGTRYMMLIDGKENIFMVDRDNAVFHVPNLEFPRRKDLNAHLQNTLVDGEMVVDKVEGLNVPRFLIYDIIKFEGLNVGKTDFDRRLLCIDKEIIGPRNAKIMAGTLDRSRQAFSVRPKPFWGITRSHSVFEGEFASQVKHEMDGLIFQPVEDPYVSGRCDLTLKWKPPSLNSVDFKLIIQQQNGIGLINKPFGCLCVGRFDQPFGQIKLNKELKTLDKQIIECSWDGTAWKFMRQRTDKSFSNSYETAMAVWNSIKNPVTKEILYNFIDRERFVAPSSNSKDQHLMPPPPKRARWGSQLTTTETCFQQPTPALHCV